MYGGINRFSVAILYRCYCNLFICNSLFTECINIYRYSRKQNDGRLTTESFHNVITQNVGYNVVSDLGTCSTVFLLQSRSYGYLDWIVWSKLYFCDLEFCPGITFTYVYTARQGGAFVIIASKVSFWNLHIIFKVLMSSIFFHTFW